jgi:O-6-methylguanine DNA methyltransferase
MQLLLERRPSPLGEMLLVSDAQGLLRALDFEDHEARMQRLLRLHYARYSLAEAAASSTVHRALDAYFAGDFNALAQIPVATNGTPFQRAVWAGLCTIPCGVTMSYGELAAQVGHPGASRAVGLANGANPVAIVVPCHRVIGKSGALTGYGGGLARKRWLLAHEAQHAPQMTLTAARDALDAGSALGAGAVLA